MIENQEAELSFPRKGHNLCKKILHLSK